MVEKAEKIKKTVSQNTLLDGTKIKITPKGKKVQCEFCKSHVIDLIKHLTNFLN